MRNVLIGAGGGINISTAGQATRQAVEQSGEIGTELRGKIILEHDDRRTRILGAETGEETGAR